MTIPLNDATLPPSPLDEVIAAYLLALESGQQTFVTLRAVDMHLLSTL